MRNTKEMMEALLAGETLITEEGHCFQLLGQDLRFLKKDYGIWQDTSIIPNAAMVKIKPKTIKINGFEVPEPLRKIPTFGKEYFIVNLHKPKGYSYITWNQDFFGCLHRGLVHTTKEAANIHAKALLSFTSEKL